ncbi:MAG: SEC-C domain-containing protein [Clostridia bacterium]|nr:SEC-C domain-containing protein [Clostridia bacterium]
MRLRVNANRKTAKRFSKTNPCPCGSGKKYKNCCGAS